MVKKFDNRIYIISLLLTFLFLVLGFLTSLYLESEKKSEYQDIALQYSLESEKTALLLMYSQIEDENICFSLDKIIDKQNAKFLKLASRVEEYSKKHVLNDYTPIKQELVISNLKLYLLLKQEISKCNKTIASPLIYVYDEKEICPDCFTTVKILEELKKRCPKIRVFAFPLHSDNEILDLIYVKHNITKAPVLILPNNQVYPGVIDINILINELKQDNIC